MNKFNQNFTYTRFGNPTLKALEEVVCYLENAKYTLAFLHWIQDISSSLIMARYGKYVILPLEVYGGTCQFATKILSNFNIETSFKICLL